MLKNRPEIDRWALALLHHTTETVTAVLGNQYDARAGGEAIESFVSHFEQLVREAQSQALLEKMKPVKTRIQPT
ncbi:MAG: hypothetical protein Ct9H300mP14_09630 [Gammaproteobacteria bacterium]|nr:MAG: hypothetical protein Ct9H300mP14_09630 [Gammaproteobacteria bacterium]